MNSYSPFAIYYLGSILFCPRTLLMVLFLRGFLFCLYDVFLYLLHADVFLYMSMILFDYVDCSW